jgi:2-oxoisovalerate dehydrogenase E1 component
MTADTVDPADAIHRAFQTAMSDLSHPGGAAPGRDLDAPLRLGAKLTGRLALSLFDAQLMSRAADLAARRLRVKNQGFYTIGSSGHEGNAAVAAALRATDPALLHYRSGAFFIQRAAAAGYEHALRDIMLGICASSEEPIAGGRHKVFGSAPLWIPPQTSTIASHLPKAVGMAFALDLARRSKQALPVPSDAIVVCSFGDASVNHSTAAGAFNAAARTTLQHIPLPVLFVCEDNGIGISVKTPPGAVRETFQGRPGLTYFSADGCDLVDAYHAACAAAEHVRRTRTPAFLHLSVVRLMGHAGSDAEVAYRTADEIRSDMQRDPLVATARQLVRSGILSGDAVIMRYDAARHAATEMGAWAATRPRLTTASSVMAPIAPRHPSRIEAAVSTQLTQPQKEARGRFWEGRLPEDDLPAPLAAQINRALGDLVATSADVLIFGEDVGRKGGVYGVTKGLQRRAGIARVFDTLLDEQTILGLAIGAGQMGLLPIPEIQYLAYLHNAEDQLRGEAATLQFFSTGKFKNPMVVRIAGYGYQKGFGGHFHNDNAVAVLRDIPGLVVASPSRGDDAVAMLRTCVAAARTDGAVCVYLEPIALYSTRDLHEAGDGGWSTRYAPPGEGDHVPIGRGRVYGEGQDLLLVSFANGVPMSLRAARRLEKRGISCRVLDLRWLAPLPVDDLIRHAGACRHVLVVDETRASGGVSEGVLAALVDAGFGGKIRRVASRDSFIPLGDAANLVLLSEGEIEEAAEGLVTSQRS